MVDDGKRLICVGKIMNEGLLTLKENYAASDKYVILFNDMLSRDTVSQAIFFIAETLRWVFVAQVVNTKILVQLFSLASIIKFHITSCA